MTKLVWRVDPKPTGLYRSFRSRQWPMATHRKTGNCAARILCADDYYPARARSGEHAELTIRIAVPRENTFDWRTLKQRAATLDQAKQLASKYFDAHPEHVW